MSRAEAQRLHRDYICESEGSVLASTGHENMVMHEYDHRCKAETFLDDTRSLLIHHWAVCADVLPLDMFVPVICAAI